MNRHSSLKFICELPLNELAYLVITAFTINEYVDSSYLMQVIFFYQTLDNPGFFNPLQSKFGTL